MSTLSEGNGNGNGEPLPDIRISIHFWLQMGNRTKRKRKTMIRINQISYLPDATKIGVFDSQEQKEFKVQTIDESVTRKTVFKGRIQKTGNSLYGDFSKVTAPAHTAIWSGW